MGEWVQQKWITGNTSKEQVEKTVRGFKDQDLWAVVGNWNFTGKFLESRERSVILKRSFGGFQKIHRITDQEGLQVSSLSGKLGMLLTLLIGK